MTIVWSSMVGYSILILGVSFNWITDSLRKNRSSMLLYIVFTCSALRTRIIQALFLYGKLYLSLSLLTWPPWISRFLNIGGWNSLPWLESRGASGTVPSGLRATLYLHPTSPPPKRLRFFYHIIPSPQYDSTLLSLSLRLLLPPPHTHPPHPQLPDPIWYPWYPGQAAPTITWIGTLLTSAPPPNTSPW